MTFEHFEQEMGRLEGLKFPPPSLRTHWEALRELPEVVLAAAVSKARDEVTEFPSPKMLKIFAEQVRPRIVPVPEEDPSRGIDLPQPVVIEDERLPGPIPITRTWRYYCDRCEDSGLLTLRCEGRGEEYASFALTRRPWVPEQRCERIKSHYAHEWAKPCPCAATNPDVQRKNERFRQSGRRGENE